MSTNIWFNCYDDLILCYGTDLWAETNDTKSECMVTKSLKSLSPIQQRKIVNPFGTLHTGLRREVPGTSGIAAMPPVSTQAGRLQQLVETVRAARAKRQNFNGNNPPEPQNKDGYTDDQQRGNLWKILGWTGVIAAPASVGLGTGIAGMAQANRHHSENMAYQEKVQNRTFTMQESQFERQQATLEKSVGQKIASKPDVRKAPVVINDIIDSPDNQYPVVWNEEANNFIPYIPVAPPNLSTNLGGIKNEINVTISIVVFSMIGIFLVMTGVGAKILIGRFKKNRDRDEARWSGMIRDRRILEQKEDESVSEM